MISKSSIFCCAVIDPGSGDIGIGGGDGGCGGDGDDDQLEVFNLWCQTKLLESNVIDSVCYL